MFELDTRLHNDCEVISQWPLCSVLLMNESRYPWFILVPRVANIREIVQLKNEQQVQLQQESNQLSHFLLEVLSADKLNVAALGNIVSQLHIHHIARYETDEAWPAPVWGKFPTTAYSDAGLAEIKKQFTEFFKDESQ